MNRQMFPFTSSSFLPLLHRHCYYFLLWTFFFKVTFIHFNIIRKLWLRFPFHSFFVHSVRHCRYYFLHSKTMYFNRFLCQFRQHSPHPTVWPHHALSPTTHMVTHLPSQGAKAGGGWLAGTLRPAFPCADSFHYVERGKQAVRRG